MFGAPIGPAFQVENLAGHPFVRGVLEEAGLLDRLEGIGLQVAKIMVELFADIDPGHELFQQFSFIDADELPDFRAIAARADRLGLEGLEGEERERLLGLPFLLIPEHHRLGLIDDAIRADLLTARRLFRERLPEADRASVEFFDADRYTARASLQDNILFGRIRHGQAHGAARVSALLGEVVDELGIRDAVMEAGLAFQVGIGGSRLTQTQRQKLAFARALLKRPALLVVNMATAGVERVAREMLFLAARTAMEGRGIVWVLEAPEFGGELPAHRRGRGGPHGGGRDLRGAEGGRRPVRPAPQAVTRRKGPMALNEEVEALRAIPLFQRIEASKLRLLAFTSERVRFEPGDLVVKEGDIGDAAYIVLEGAAEVLVDTPQGPLKVADVGRNDIVGEIAILIDVPRTATVRATDAVTALRISKELFFRLVAEFPQMAVEIMRELAQRLDRTTNDLREARAQLAAG